MPEPHNPEHSEGSDRGFKPSVPDLRPNLGEYHTVGTGNPDQGLATHFENNEEGNEADRFYRQHQERGRGVELFHEDTQEAREAYNDLHIASEELRFAIEDLEQSDPDNFLDRGILARAQEIIEERKISTLSRQTNADVATSHMELSQIKNDLSAGVHYRNNEEAYKNQAVNDARRAGVDVNYPPYTDQEPTTPAHPDGFI